MRQTPLRIVACLDVRHRASQDVIAGVLRFAAAHPEWDIQMRGNHPANDGFAVDADWSPDGLIIDSSWKTRMGSHLLSSPSLKGIIFVSTLPPSGCQIPHEVLSTDDRTLAETATRLFVKHGLRNFGFVSAGSDERWSSLRRRFFGAALEKAGLSLDVYSPQRRKRHGWKDEFDALAKWIEQLPKPCGILVAHDQRAKHVLDVCRLTGVDVPEQVQVLGVDDESYICEQTFPTLSSVAPDFERGGFAAAETLNAMLNGRTPKLRRLKIPVKGVTERLSTTDISGSGTRVSRAREFIRRNACEPITVGSVVRVAGCSERLLEKNFKMVLGHSVCREIQEQRLALVTKALKETARPIDDIARSSGFKNGNYLKNLFRSRFGMTMREYRERD